ncbi:MAG: hypothetical protein ACR2O1_08330 [Boseongicola sp.]
MQRIWLIFLLLAAPVQAQEHAVQVINGIRMIDATKLSVAEMRALAAAERENPTHVNCCDWSGGGGCNPSRARALMGLPERISQLVAEK